MIQMNANLTRKLHTDFPVLYRGIDLSPQASAMCWGFECGDGWYSLIYELSERLVAYQQQCPGLDLEITPSEEQARPSLHPFTRRGHKHSEDDR